MLEVNHKERIGYYYEENKKVWLCKSNATWAEMYFYREKITNKRWAQLCGFVVDSIHLDKMLKNKRYKTDKFYFYGKYVRENPDLWIYIKTLCNNNKTIEII